MSIPSRPTGQDPQSYWLYEILRQLDYLTKVVASSAPPTTTTIPDGADVAEGTTTDNKNLATDTTPATVISLLKAISYLLQHSLAVTIADGADATLGSKADARDAHTDSTAITLMQVAKEISYLLQNKLGVTLADGDLATLGTKADARSSATDTTAVTVMQVIKEISYLLQNALATTVANGGNVALGSTTDAKSAATDGTAATAISLLKELSYLLQSVEGVVTTSRNTTTVVLATQQIGPSGYPADVNQANELKTYNPPATMLAEYRSPTDFAVTYASSTTLTVTGAPFLFDDSVIRVTSIMVKNVSGVFTGYYNGRGGVSITCSSGTITIAGAGTPFLNTDTQYDVNVIGPRKAYDQTTDTTKVSVQNPANMNYVLDSIAFFTNSTSTGVNYFPSSTGMQMDGFTDMSISGLLQDTVGISMTVEGTNDETLASANWVQLWGSDLKNNVPVTIINTSNSTFFWSFDNMNVSTIRIKVTITTSGANAVTIKMRRK